MLGGLKSSLAFAGVTLFGAAMLAATFATPGTNASRNDGGYNDAEYVPPPPDEATLTSTETSYEEQGASEFASDEELIDPTSGFDPSAAAQASGANDESGQSPDAVEVEAAVSSEITGEGGSPAGTVDM